MGGSVQLPTPGSVRLPRGWVSSVADPGQLGCRITAAQSNQQRAIDLLESQRGSVEDHYFERLHSYQRQEAWVDQNLFGMVADG
jgi:hypothetical protein